ncbi:hypothetical protein EUA76_00890 [TM7 phylum sp. oral taxon 350]|nr:hypothetical protein EUA76_00890 [TM7 phylum sp. oral taxon 350]
MPTAKNKKPTEHLIIIGAIVIIVCTILGFITDQALEGVAAGIVTALFFVPGLHFLIGSNVSKKLKNKLSLKSKTKK